MTRTGRYMLGLALSAGLLASNPALSQVAHPAPSERNAALQYQALFYADLPKELTDAIDAVELDKVGLESDPAKQPDAFKTAAKMVSERQGAVRRFIAATQLDKCDFEIAYEQGFNAIIPHLGLMRKSARMLRVDARRLLLEGQPDAAAQRIVAIYGLARHLKGDNVLISSLVSIAVAGLANSESEVLIKSGRLTAVGRESLVQAATRMGEKDPFGVKAAVVGERTITVKWIRDRFPAPGSGPAFVKEVTQEWGLVPGSREELNEVEKMDDAAFAASLARLDEYHSLMQSQWDLPDAPARLEVLSNRIGSGDFGPLAKFLAPSFAKARSGQQKAEAELDLTLRHLKDYKPAASSPK